MQHNIDPIAFHLFGQAISWYWLFYPLAYIAIFYASIFYIQQKKYAIARSDLIDFFTMLWISLIVGGRLGYFLIYQSNLLIEQPSILLSLHLGGMSFHGAMLGVIVFLFIYQKVKKASAFTILDIAILFSPIALFFGRLGNFINGELWGRPSDLPWAMVFPAADLITRHPSQLYQAITEGPILLAILFVFKKDKVSMHNSLLFVATYSILRIITEYFREPDTHLGFVFQYLTYGQILSLITLLLSLYFLWRLPSAKYK